MCFLLHGAQAPAALWLVAQLWTQLAGRRCLALVLYHGSSVCLHLLTAQLLRQSNAAVYKHERIKCLTLVAAFAIMMVRTTLLQVFDVYMLRSRVTEAQSQTCSESLFAARRRLACLRGQGSRSMGGRGVMEWSYAGWLVVVELSTRWGRLRGLQVGFTILFAREQTDLRGAPSMPVPVTAIYCALLVRGLSGLLLWRPLQLGTQQMAGNVRSVWRHGDCLRPFQPG